MGSQIMARIQFITETTYQIAS
uniref:Uncharacterized protein n=1 Tax=Arundo donax TaxID=35708 RepID=A0A0A8YF64_ARUDO